MQRAIKCHRLKRLIPFFLICVTLLFNMRSMKVHASSWIDRDSSGIYNGSVSSGIEEDAEEDAEDGVEDEGNAWYVELFNTIITAIPITIGNLLFGILNTLGASLDQIIYGRLVTDVPLFTFGLEDGNIYGIVAAAVYNLLRGVAIVGCMAVLMVGIAGSAWKRGQFAFSGLKDSITGFAVAVLALALMPNFVDLGLFIRDNILYLVATDGASALFGSSSVSIVGMLKEAASESILNSVMYMAAVLLNLIYIADYGMIALSMFVDFVLFPFVILKSHFEQTVMKNWIWEMVSCAIVPIIDATLIMIPVYFGVYASRIGLTEGVALSMLQVVICWLIRVARDYAKFILGVRTTPLQSAGLGAASFMAMRAIRGVKDAISDFREERKNAESDERQADLEQDLSALDADERMRQTEAMRDAQDFSGYASVSTDSEAGGMPDAGQAGEDDTEFSPRQASDFAQYDNGEPVGMEQSYAEGMEAYQEASMAEVDDALAERKKQRKDLEEQYRETESDPSLSEDERADRLNDISQQMDALDAESKALMRRKMDIQEEQESEYLKMDPVNLQKELSDAEKQREELLNERQALVRQRTKLQEEQDALGSDSPRYQELEKQIGEVDESIRTLDVEMAANEGRRHTVSRALTQQENGLLDRQAYNLTERVKAQTEYDDAKERLGGYQNELKGTNVSGRRRTELENAVKEQTGRMESAQRRLADLSVEDARISEKLAEFRPDRNTYKVEDLQKAKGEQQIRRAEAQSKISILNAEISALDPSDNAQKIEIEQKRQRIVQLTAEAADASLQSARIDQMINGMKAAGGTGSIGSPRSGQPTAIQSEYDRKRQAVMERYATIDNFEEPQFSNLSHERRAELLRERALHTRRSAWARAGGRVAGTVAGASMALWTGPSGMLVGGMVGSDIGAGVTGKIVDIANARHLRNSGVLPNDYTGQTLEVHVASDLQGRTISEQRELVNRIKVNFERALDGDMFAQEFQTNMIDQNLIEQQRKLLLSRNQIKCRADYERKLPELRKQLMPMALTGIQSAEMRVLERCAGEEYTRLSEPVKKRIVKRVTTQKAAELEDFLRDLYLPDQWDQHFLD